MTSNKKLTLNESIKQNERDIEIFNKLVGNTNFPIKEKRLHIVNTLRKECKDFAPRVEDYKKNSIIN